MKRYRTVEVGYLRELFDIVDDELTVRECRNEPTCDSEEPRSWCPSEWYLHEAS